MFLFAEAVPAVADPEFWTGLGIAIFGIPIFGACLLLLFTSLKLSSIISMIVMVLGLEGIFATLIPAVVAVVPDVSSLRVIGTIFVVVGLMTLTVGEAFKRE